MGSTYKKSAKDLAFDRKITKLNSIIQKNHEEIVDLKARLNRANMEIESLNRTIEIMEAAMQIPREELIANMERTKKISALLKDPFSTVIGKYIGGL